MDLTSDFTLNIWPLNLYFPRVANFSPLCAVFVVEAGQAEHAARAQLPVQCAQGRRRRQRRPRPGGRRDALHGNPRQCVSAAE